jgi:hypothetical protein
MSEWTRGASRFGSAFSFGALRSCKILAALTRAVSDGLFSRSTRASSDSW